MFYIGNAFSLQMVQDFANVAVSPATATEVKEGFYKNLPSSVKFCIGHADTARIAAKELANVPYCNDWVEFNEELVFHRVNINLVPGDVLYVLQVVGGRLPEGCTELPEGIQLQWRKVVVTD